MIELKDILLFLSGLATGTGAAWFLMRNRLVQIREQARAAGEAAQKSTSLITQLKEQQFDHLQQEIKKSTAEIESIHTQLRREAATRAAAEEKNSRIPVLETALVNADKGKERLVSENSALLAKISELETRLAAERSQAVEKLTVLQEAKDQLKLEFQHLADRIFEDKSRKFTDENKRNLDGVLSPVREQLADFKKRIEDVYDKESKERVSLFNEIVHLKTLNQKISDDAVSLTNALKGQSKTQGTWGEVILERILEESGLQKGREYETQACHVTDGGRQLRPDVVLHLPGGKDVIIDSKVSLTAYERYCSAPTAERREKRLKEHILSIRNHIKGLSEKRYEDLPGVRTLDFVLMFLPIEGAFWAAIEQDAGLFDNAFARNIMLVGPSTLLATLRIIQNTWRHEDRNRNAITIAQKAGDLYDKFVGFVESLEDIGAKITKAQESYYRAKSQLAAGRGNLIRRTEELKALGVKTKKTCPVSLVEEAAGEEEAFSSAAADL